MIINKERSPKNSLYYIGAIILKKIVENNGTIQLEKLINSFDKQEVGIKLIYFSLDWLYLINKIEIKNERIYLK